MMLETILFLFQICICKFQTGIFSEFLIRWCFDNLSTKNKSFFSQETQIVIRIIKTKMIAIISPIKILSLTN